MTVLATPSPAQRSSGGRHVRRSPQALWWEAMRSKLPSAMLPSWIPRRRRFRSQLGLASLTAALMLTTYSLPAYAADTPHELTVAAGVEQQELQTMAVGASAAKAMPTLTYDDYTVTMPPPPPKKVEKEASPVAKPAPVKAPAAAPSSPTASESGAAIWPVGSGVRISDGFGPRRSPCGGCSTDHKGVDMLGGAETPVLSVADGTVSQVSSWDNGSYGVFAMVEHVIGGRKVTSVYAHMQSGSLAVAPGQKVSQGQQLGRVGNTGASTGPHLHLEIRLDGVPVDPLGWLKAND